MANNGGNNSRPEAPESSSNDPIELVARLDREIDKLRQLAPPGYEHTIRRLREVMLLIHDAVDSFDQSKPR